MEVEGRSPQVRFTYKANNWEYIVAAAGQNMFVSPGPCGYSYRYMAQSATPNLHGQIRYTQDEFVLGAALDYKRLCPRLVTQKCVATNEIINSVIAEAFAAYNGEKFNFRIKGIFAQNGADQLAMSGYAVAHAIAKRT